ncbi:hypothetical protein KP509_24G078500 [Ceratopteris richardii]|uniref:Uncharacterized protein n=1 Tax=Ceratopteris richardii TaxID=49495 RepID=A0A8T2RY54_CERRI|nr:hypothetical protein KP509_24G078500 [Ceratopteris richardii]
MKGNEQCQPELDYMVSSKRSSSVPSLTAVYHAEATWREYMRLYCVLSRLTFLRPLRLSCNLLLSRNLIADESSTYARFLFRELFTSRHLFLLFFVCVGNSVKSHC